MAGGTITSGTRLGGWRLWAPLALIASGALYFLIERIHLITDLSPASYTDYFWWRRFGLWPHMAGGATAIGVGLVQLWLGLTGRTHRLHRLLGRIYLGAVALGVAAAAYLVATGSGPVSWSTGLAGLALAWAATTAMAYVSIRRGRVEPHRDWMMRSYAVTFAFVTFRLLDELARPLFHVPPNTGTSNDDYEGLAAWAGWVVPLLLIEALIQFRRLRSH
jgi:uncharacterized membrane protein